LLQHDEACYTHSNKITGEVSPSRIAASPWGPETSRKAQKEEKKKLDLCLNYEKSRLKDDYF
jgi:hypothetical protein